MSELRLFEKQTYENERKICLYKCFSKIDIKTKSKNMSKMEYLRFRHKNEQKSYV